MAKKNNESNDSKSSNERKDNGKSKKEANN